MYALLGPQGVTQAYIEKNRIVDAESLQLMGILLGNCVFDCSGKMKGKFLDNVLYAMDGKILAKGNVMPPVPAVEELLDQHRQEGAAVLQSITNHTDIWIFISDAWSGQALQEVLPVRMYEIAGN